MTTITNLNRKPDGVFETLEATDTFTDPAGISYDGAINPVQVLEEASTFAEGDVTVTNNNTTVSSGLIKLSPGGITDFEDGDISPDGQWGGWQRDTGNFSAQQSTVISGSYSGELVSSGSDITVETERSAKITDNLSFTVRIGSDVGSEFDETIVIVEETLDGNQIGRLVFEDDNNNVEFAGTEVLSSWSPDTNYAFEYDYDFANDEVDIIVNGTNEGTFNFQDSASGYSAFVLSNNTAASSSTRSVFIDDIIAGSDATSGDALIGWDSGSPADINSYDLATFQRTLDGETVTIDVEDGNGNVLFSDISQNFDISTVDTSKNVKLRANFSRTDTSNNPTLDYAARRFNR